MSVVVLTGAGSGIGACTADLLRERGDRLVLIARSDARAAELARRHPDAAIEVLDLADTAAVERWRPAGGIERLDGLVHAAGVVELGALAEADAGQWERTLAVNLTAPALLTRTLLPALRQGSGTVVLLNSSAGRQAHPQWSAYAASKFGLRALADALRDEEASSGVRVSTVYPGRTATPMQRSVHEQEGRDYDPARWIDPATVARSVMHCLDLPADATIPELVVRPGPGLSAG